MKKITTKKLKEDLKIINNLLDLETPKDLTQEEKDLLLSISDSYDIPRPKNYQCPNCWNDLMILIRIKIKNLTNLKSDRKYVLRSNIDVIWKGIRVNNDTITDELAEQYIKDGFPLSFFLRK